MSNKTPTKADLLFTASQQRDAAAKAIATKERAAFDTKSAKLRALRLAKEAADKEAAKLNPEASAAPKKRTRRAAP